jgi:branched-chain amino acid transport system permease protein
MEYLIHIGILVTIYGMLALSLNLVVGEVGLLSVTQAAFYGIGAYVTALLLTETGVSFFVALPLGMIVTAIIALAIGIVFSRFKEDYYALGSFGFNVIIVSVFLNWQSVTRGPLGIPGIPRPEMFHFPFSDNLSFLGLSLFTLFVVYALYTFIEQSSYGRVLHAIREDEEMISVFGYNPLYFKLSVFVISAMLASVAGSFFATYITFIDPSSFSLNESIFVLATIILGGLASKKGAVYGAMFLIVLPELLRFVGFPSDIAAQMRQVVYGLILIFLMLYRPQGLFGQFRM